MREIERIVEQMKQHQLEEIYRIGVLMGEEEGMAEYVQHPSFLYLKFGDQLLEIQEVESYGRLRLRLLAGIPTYSFLEDESTIVTRIGQIVFMNPMQEYNVRDITFFNLDETEEGLYSEVLQLHLENGQLLFIDPGLLGLTIGGVEQRQLWYENYEERVLPLTGAFPQEATFRIME